MGDPTEENRNYFAWQMLVGAYQSLVWCGGTETCLGSWLQHSPTAQRAAVGCVQRPQQCPCGAEHLSALCWGERCPPPCWYHQERQGCECGTARSLPVALVYHLVMLVHTPGGFGTQQMLKFPPWFSFPHPSLLELPSQWLWTGPAQFPSLISSLRGRNQHFAIVYWDYHNLISQLSFCCPFMGVCCQGALNNLHFLSGAHVPQPQVEQLINRQAAMLAAVWLLLISATKFMQPLSHVCLFAAQRRD